MNTLIKYTFRYVFYNPLVNILNCLQLIIIIICTFFLNFIYDNSGQIAIVKIFGSNILANIFFNDILPTLSYLLIFVILIIIIISFGNLYTRLYNNPFNKLILISNISRVKLILYSFSGINLYFLINFAFFSIALSLIIYFKTNDFITEPFIIFTNLFLFLLSLSVIINLFGFLLKNESISSLIGILFPVLISPYISKVVNNADPFLEKILLAIYYLIPPLTIELNNSLKIYDTHIFNMDKILLTIPYIFSYLLIVLYLFKKVDIND